MSCIHMRSAACRVLLLCCGALIGCLGSFGQPPNPGPGADQDQGSSAAQEPTIRVDVNLVNVFFTVKTKKGQLIPDLKKDDFSISEDGKPQTIERFSRETDLPLTLGLLIDISASQERLIDIERQAASQFFTSVIRPKDEAFLISFGKSTDLLQDYTSSPRQLTAALRDLRGDGVSSAGMYNPGPVGGNIGTPKGTLLFDAIYLASNEKLKSEVGRKALILITDGEDEGSTYKLRDAVEAAQKANAIIYSIYYVDRQFYAGGGFMIGGGGGESGLEKMSSETGGHVFKVDAKHSLSDIFKEIQEEMRNQYSLGYRSANPNQDGSFRRIQLKVDNADYRVQCRSGYYATKNDEQ
jgi:VWFA-related protein